MKYNNAILNKIVEIYSSQSENDLGLESIIPGYIESMKRGSKIHIKPENKGKFTASAKKAGEGVQEHAHKVMNNPNATALQKKRANFAIQAKRWHKK